MCEFGIPEEDESVSTITADTLFRYVKNDQANEIIKESGGMEIEICRRAIIRWRKFVDSDGTEIEWSKENFEEAISHPMIAAEWVRQWARSLTQVAKKN